MGRHHEMTANEADDIISELGTAEVSRRYGFGGYKPSYGPPAKHIAMHEGECHRICQEAVAQIERAFGKRK